MWHSGFPGGASGTEPTSPHPHPLPVKETQFQSLGWEDPLEEEMATHSNILAWKNPMDRRAWRATVHGVAESDTTEAT